MSEASEPSELSEPSEPSELTELSEGHLLFGRLFRAQLLLTTARLPPPRPTLEVLIEVRLADLPIATYFVTLEGASKYRSS
jgi:hypothetical protein